MALHRTRMRSNRMIHGCTSSTMTTAKGLEKKLEVLDGSLLVLSLSLFFSLTLGRLILCCELRANSISALQSPRASWAQSSPSTLARHGPPPTFNSVVYSHRAGLSTSHLHDGAYLLLLLFRLAASPLYIFPTFRYFSAIVGGRRWKENHAHMFHICCTLHTFPFTLKSPEKVLSDFICPIDIFV